MSFLRSRFMSSSSLAVFEAEGAGGGAPADAPGQTQTPSSAAATVAPAPASDAAAASPPAESPAAAAPIPEPAPAAPAADAAPAAANVAGKESSPSSLLEAADGKKPVEPGKEEPAAADAKPGEEVKPAEGEAKPAEGEAAKPEGAEAAPAQDAAASEPPAIVFDAFKFPEGVTADEKMVGGFTEALQTQTGPLEKAIKSGDRAAITKAFQDFGQTMVDYYQNQVTPAIAEQALQHQRDVWDTQVKKWVSDFKADEKLGGARANTTLSMAKAVIEEFGGSAEERQELYRHIGEGGNGMGNYLGFIRLMANIGEKLNIFEDKIVPAPNPLKGAQARSRSDKWYGSVDAPSNTPG